jgi:hypothetical protein
MFAQRNHVLTFFFGGSVKANHARVGVMRMHSWCMPDIALPWAGGISVASAPSTLT